jgi:hypothetical protein
LRGAFFTFSIQSIDSVLSLPIRFNFLPKHRLQSHPQNGAFFIALYI